MDVCQCSLYWQPELSAERTGLVFEDIQHKLNVFSLSRGSPHSMVETFTGGVFKSSSHNIPDSFLPLHHKQKLKCLFPFGLMSQRFYQQACFEGLWMCGHGGGADSTRCRLCNSCRIRWWASLCINVDHFNLFFYTWGKYSSSLVIFEPNRFICQEYESTTHLSGMQATCNSVKRRKAYFFIWLCVKRLKLTKDSLLAPSCRAVSPPDRRLSVSYSKCESYSLLLYGFVLL